MSAEKFVFKQFSIVQQGCAHKVGTDGVLIGAWAEAEGANFILDIGTGSGIISLMMAQKSPTAIIDAIDIEEGACLQAKENVAQSPWKERIRIHHCPLQKFELHPHRKYDLIITNPPFFVDSFKAPDEDRSHARHNDALPFPELIDGVLNLLTPQGKFYIILPTKEAGDFKNLAEKKHLHLIKRLRVKTKMINGSEKRHLMQFSLSPRSLHDYTLSIEKEGRHDYTEEYKKLTEEFYLHF